jgi:4-oxalocrotonate tautomerase family enzyme
MVLPTPGSPSPDPTSAIGDVLLAYFDGLYTSDATMLAGVFHPSAIYATATPGHLVHLGMDGYLAIVADRTAPAARDEVRRDEVLAIDLVGPVTAFAKVECAIGEHFYTDLLTLVHVDGRWQIIAKVFHYDIEPCCTDQPDDVKITREGATASQKAEIISDITASLARVLDKDPATTFVVIDEVELENWGIGGLPVHEYRRQAST